MKRTVGMMIFVGSLALCAPASAATIVVGPTDDAQNGSFDDTGCTLRDAVESANTNMTITNGCNGDNAGADTIVLKGGQTYKLDLSFTPEDNNVYGDLDIDGPVTITTDGGLATIDGYGNNPATGNRDRVFQVKSTAGTVSLQDLKIQNGWVNASAPHGEGGGGILNQGDLTIVNSEVDGNHVDSGSVSAMGGGIFTKSPGTLTVLGSTIAGNTMQAQSNQVVGGGIAVYPAPASLVMQNSTVSGNNVNGSSPAPGGYSGFVGGVFANDQISLTPATLTNVTITGNSATNYGSITGNLQQFGGTVTGSVIAGGTDPGQFSPDCQGGPQSGGGNVVGVGDVGCTSWGAGDRTGTQASPLNAKLGNLVNNGGLTRTHHPNAGSPAINIGGSCLTTDQRGFFRAPVAPCDAGAVEVGAPSSLPAQPAAAAAAGPTGQQAAALAKCKKKKSKKKRKKCRKKALLLPV